MRPFAPFRCSSGLRPLVLLLGILAPLHSSWADPNSPVTISLPPTDQGEFFDSALRPAAGLPASYVQEEFFVSGEVDVFKYNDPPVPGELVLRDDTETLYTTRIIVKRPIDPSAFNGTVVLEWMNSSAGFDTQPAWDPSSSYFIRNGYIVVEYTNSPTAVQFLKNGCALLGILPPSCGTRYAALSIPELGQAFEAGSQIAKLLKGGEPHNPIPAAYAVERLYHVGQSQQGGYMVTYANEFHIAENDAYFIQAAGSARQISSGSPIFSPGQVGRLVKTDMPVPVVRAQTETDMAGVLASASRQTDAPNFRYYEMAGVAHTTVHRDIEVIPPGVFGPDPIYLEDLCASTPNTSGDGPVYGRHLYNAMWRNLELQVQFGAAPPSGNLLETSGTDLVRDIFGNATGGLRTPDMNVPTASYGPNNTGKPLCTGGPGEDPDTCLPSLPLVFIGQLACGLSGTTTAFSEPLLDVLYPSHLDYWFRVYLDALRLWGEGFLTSEDFVEIIIRAIFSPVGT